MLIPLPSPSHPPPAETGRETTGIASPSQIDINSQSDGQSSAASEQTATEFLTELRAVLAAIETISSTENGATSGRLGEAAPASDHVTLIDSFQLATASQDAATSEVVVEPALQNRSHDHVTASTIAVRNAGQRRLVQPLFGANSPGTADAPAGLKAVVDAIIAQLPNEQPSAGTHEGVDPYEGDAGDGEPATIADLRQLQQAVAEVARRSSRLEEQAVGRYAELALPTSDQRLTPASQNTPALDDSLARLVSQLQDFGIDVSEASPTGEHGLTVDVAPLGHQAVSQVAARGRLDPLTINEQGQTPVEHERLGQPASQTLDASALTAAIDRLAVELQALQDTTENERSLPVPPIPQATLKRAASDIENANGTIPEAAQAAADLTTVRANAATLSNAHSDTADRRNEQPATQPTSEEPLAAATPTRGDLALNVPFEQHDETTPRLRQRAAVGQQSLASGTNQSQVVGPNDVIDGSATQLNQEPALSTKFEASRTSHVPPAAASDTRAVQVATQVVAAVEEAVESNVNPLRVRLDPPELGSIAVEVRRDAGQIRIEVQFESVEALRIARDGIDAFREALVAKGFDIDPDNIRLQLEIGRETKVGESAASTNDDNSNRDQTNGREQQSERQAANQDREGRSSSDGSDQADGSPRFEAPPPPPEHVEAKPTLKQRIDTITATSLDITV